MKSRFRKLGVESLEGRSVLSTMYQADFNGDGRLDQAAVTNLGTIEIRLDNGSGGYNVSSFNLSQGASASNCCLGHVSGLIMTGSPMLNVIRRSLHQINPVELRCLRR